MARALFRLLLPKLVNESVARLNRYSPPSIILEFSDFYQPLMLYVAARLGLGADELHPQILCPATMTKLRPIALQTLKKK